MPKIFELAFHGRPPSVPWRHCTGLRAAVADRYAAVDPVLGKALHDGTWRPAGSHASGGGSPPKPYWVSPLWPADDPDLTRVIIGLCCDELAEPLLQGLQLLPVFELGRDRFELLRYRVLGDEGFATLANPPEPLRRSWRFQFVTPVAHHQQAGSRKKSSPLPTPESCWRSWLVRWNIWAPAPQPEELEQCIVDGMELVKFFLESETVHLKPTGSSSRGERLVGAVGEVIFEMKNASVSPYLLQGLNALARFAPYCGTGRESARGCGITRLAAQTTPEEG